MFSRLKNSAERCALYSWCALPIMGQVFAPFFIIATVLCRNRRGAFRPTLVAFCALCAVYTGYIALRALLAGPWQEAVEPAGDAASLLITVGLLTWALRGRQPLDPGRTYVALATMLLCVWALASVEFWITEQPPVLLLHNQLNLSPMLLAPAVLCTMFPLAPSRRMAFLGWAAFVAAVVTVSALCQTRGPTLVLIGLVALRLGFVALGPREKGARLTHALAILAGLGLGLAPALFNKSVQDRFLIADTEQATCTGARPCAVMLAQAEHAPVRTDAPPIAALSQSGDQSVNERLAMLKAGWQSFRAAPLWGHGPQNRFDAAHPYLPPAFPARYSHLHNEFLTHAVAGGLPAVVLLMAVLASPFIAALRSPAPRSTAVEIGLYFSAAFTGVALVNNVLFVDISAFSLGLSFTLAFLLIDSGPANRDPAKSSR